MSRLRTLGSFHIVEESTYPLEVTRVPLGGGFIVGTPGGFELELSRHEAETLATKLLAAVVREVQGG